ncbi:hypothetical protein JCM21900_003797 [Sporobolomyces salmonicolor]
MVTTRSQDHSTDTKGASSASQREKRAAEPAGHAKHGGKKAKVEKAEAGGRAKDDTEDKHAEGKTGAEEEGKGEENGEGAKAVVGSGKEQGAKAESDGTKSDGTDDKEGGEAPKGNEEAGNASPGQIPVHGKHLAKEDAERKHGLLEKGHVYFLYRPKVEVDEPHSLDDVSKFHMLLVPHHAKLHRLIAIGKKALPDASVSSRPIWGEVLNVGEDLKGLKEALGAYTYETKTRGTRHQPGARVAACGAYVLHATEHPPEQSWNASAVWHTHMAYEVAVPHQLGEVQEALHIHEQGVFTLQVKNPETESTNPIVGNQPASKHPQFPPALKAYFKTKFIPANPPAFLNYPGAELLLLPSKHSPEQDIGSKAEEVLEGEEKELDEEIEAQKDGGEAKKALKEIGLEGLIEGKALEGHWE